MININIKKIYIIGDFILSNYYMLILHSINSNYKVYANYFKKIWCSTEQKILFSKNENHIDLNILYLWLK